MKRAKELTPPNTTPIINPLYQIVQPLSKNNQGQIIMALPKARQKAFSGLAAAILATADGFIMAQHDQVKDFEAEGLVEVNASIGDADGNVGVRLTEAGGAVKAPTSEPRPTFSLEDDVELPANAARGRKTEMYPFEQMKPGQSFFVAATADKPEPAKSLASTVSGATKRYAEVVEGETRTNRKGRTVPVTRETRKFVVKAVEGGARVWRIA